MRRLAAVVRFLALAAVMTCCGPHRPPQREARAPFVRAAWPWLYSPEVLVCPGAPVDVDDVQMALLLWHAHGAPLLEARYSGCFEPVPLPGRVYVFGYDRANPSPYWKENTVGITYLSMGCEDGTGCTWGAIELLTSSRRVLTHEIGHLWLDHAQTRPHVMAPQIEDFQWGAWDGVAEALAAGGY